MKRLLAVTALAAGSLLPTAMPAAAAPTQPSPGDQLLCPLDYHTAWDGGEFLRARPAARASTS